MGEPYDLDALIEDRSRGHLLRWVQAIDAGFAGGGDAKAKVLEAYAVRTSSDFWHFMVETAEGKSAPPSGWAVEAARRVVEHNRGGSSPNRVGRKSPVRASKPLDS